MLNDSCVGESFIREMQLAFPHVKVVSGRKSLLMRCQYCPDSRDPTHAHMYISVPQHSDEPIQFHCVKCEAGGLVTTRRIMEWGAFNPELIVNVSNHNKQAKVQHLISKDAMVYKPIIPVPDNTALNRKKLDYINNRLGISLTLNDMPKYKIILSIAEFLDANYISKITRDENIIMQFEQTFLGFLSYDGAFINLRNLGFSNVYKTIDKRYVNYNIFNKTDNTMKFYIIPNNQIYTTQTIRVNIAEGPFDILSIRTNLLGQNNMYNSIDIAATGKGYIGVIRFLLTTLKLVNIEIHIYKDSDMDWNALHYIKNQFAPFNIPMYVHCNIYNGEKDMGVPLSRINETIQPI